jgi:hypothetical protein
LKDPDVSALVWGGVRFILVVAKAIALLDTRVIPKTKLFVRRSRATYLRLTNLYAISY